MNIIKYNVIVDAWLGQIVVTGYEVGIVLFTQMMAAVYGVVIIYDIIFKM